MPLNQDGGPSITHSEPNNSLLLECGVQLEKTAIALNVGPEEDKKPLMSRYLDPFTLKSSQDHWQGDTCSRCVKNKKLF